MDFTERKNFFNEIEEKFPVEKWVVRDMEIWPFIRFYLNKSIIEKRELTNRIKFGKIIFELAEIIKESVGFIGYFLFTLLDYKKNGSINKPADIVFFTQSTRRTFLGGKYFDRICDPFIDVFNKLNFKVAVLEWTYEHKYKIPRYNKSFLIQPYIDWVIIKSLVFKNKGYISFNELEKFEDFTNFILLKGIELGSWVKRSERDFFILYNLKKYFKRKLLHIKPKIIFLYPYFGIFGFSIIAASKELGIKSVDIQHGYSGKINIIYQGFKRLPEKGYKLLPEIFWGWDDNQKNYIESWNMSVKLFHYSFTGGNLWLNCWKDKDSEMTTFYRNKFNRFKAYKSVTILILITLSPNLLHPKWLINAINMAPEDWFFGIRLHHNTTGYDRRQIFKEFKKPGNVTFSIFNRSPLPAVLRNIDIHVTVESSCLIEAKFFGIPSVVIDKRGAEIFEQEIKTGWAKPAYSESEFLDSLIYQNGKKTTLHDADQIETNLSNTEIINKFITAIKLNKE